MPTASGGTAAASAARRTQEKSRGEDGAPPAKRRTIRAGSCSGACRSIRPIEEHEGVSQEVEKVPERQGGFPGVLPVHHHEVAVVRYDVPCTEVVVLRHGRERRQLVHQFWVHAELVPPRYDVALESPSLRAHCLRRALREPGELEDPAADPLDQPQLDGSVARRTENVAQPFTRGGGLERCIDSVDIEATGDPRRVRGYDVSGGACQLQTPLVVVEPLRVTGDTRELQDPLRPVGAGSKELEGVPAEGVALTERQEPAHVARNAELARGGDQGRRPRGCVATVTTGDAHDGNSPREMRTRAALMRAVFQGRSTTLQRSSAYETGAGWSSGSASVGRSRVGRRRSRRAW